MGVYTQTSYNIVTKTKKSALLVKKAIKELQKNDENGNDYGYKTLNISKGEVAGFMSSGRYQNLEYKCEQLWNTISAIEGVEYLNAPFLVEDGDNFYRTNEE